MDSSASAATYVSYVDDDIFSLNKSIWDLINFICILINKKSNQVDKSMGCIKLKSLDSTCAIVKINHLERSLQLANIYFKFLCSILSSSRSDSKRETETASRTDIKTSIFDFAVALAPVTQML